MLALDYTYYAANEPTALGEKADPTKFCDEVAKTYLVKAAATQLNQHIHPSSPLRLYFAGHLGYMKEIVKSLQASKGWAPAKFGDSGQPRAKPVNAGVFKVNML